MPDLQINVNYEGNDAASGLSGLTDIFGNLGGIAGGAVAVALGGVLKDAFEGVTGAVGNMLGAAAGAELGQARLAAALNSTADRSGLTTQAAQALALQFRDLYGGSQEVALGIEEIGIRSGEVSAAQMPAFLKAVADLGSVMGSATTAAELLARAQDDPLGALTRVERQTGVYDLALKQNITTMVKAGDTADAVAAVMQFVATATGGNASEAADTLSGKWSILTSHFQTFLATIGGPFVAAIENLLDVANPTLDGVYQKFENTFLPLITEMAAWGQALVQVLAEGMQSAFGLVVDVINQLGSIIASLIEPGSPPKFLPNLDKWGEEAVNVYMGGWSNFDKSVFDELYKAIKAGLPTQEIQQYADATKALSDAQTELNAVTAHYDNLINPLSDKLKGLQFQQEKLADQDKIAKLREILTDTGYSAADKQNAQLEIQSILTKEQIDGLELEKNKAVGAAKTKVSAAQQAAASLKNNIDLQLEFTKQTSAGAAAVKGLSGAIKTLNDALAGVGAGAGGKIDAAMQDLKTKIAQRAEEIRIAIQQKFGDLQEAIANLFAPGGIFAPVTAAMEALQTTLKDPALQDAFKSVFKWLADNKEVVIGALAGAVAGVIALAIGVAGLDAVTGVLAGFGAALALVFSPVIILAALIVGLSAAIGALFAYMIVHTGFDTIVNNFKLAFFAIKGAVEGDIATIESDLSTAWAAIQTDWDGFWNGFQSSWQGDWDLAKTIVGTVWDDIEAAIQTKWADIAKWFDSLGPQLNDIGNNIIQGIVDGINAAAGSIQSALSGIINAAIDHIKHLLGIASPSKVFSEIGMNMMAGMSQGINQNAYQPARATAGAVSQVTNAAYISVDARGAANPSAVEEAGYRGARRALAESGYRADTLRRMGTVGA